MSLIIPVHRVARTLLLPLLAMLLGGCVTKPDAVRPVESFSLERYLGTWYEIARLDHSFERGLSRVTAHYSLDKDGSVRVVNRGYSEEKQQWREAVGRALFVNQPDQGFLKVSFFGPFYGAYVIIDLDEHYRYALVCGPNTSYLWLLARTSTIPDPVKERLVAKAAGLGFATSDLIFVKHD